MGGRDPLKGSMRSMPYGIAFSGALTALGSEGKSSIVVSAIGT